MDAIYNLLGKGKKENAHENIEINFGKEKTDENAKYKAHNYTRTSKYTWYSWAPLSFLYQFTRVANVYFLIISILTALPFSPKSPGSMIGTFAAVLIFTMFKELFEDIFRMWSDMEVNNAGTYVLNYDTNEFEKCRWRDIKLGDMIRVKKDQTFPCDLLCIYSKQDKVNVDTMNLDGETALKPKKVVSNQLYNRTRGVFGESESVVVNDAMSDDSGHYKALNKYSTYLSTISGTINCGPPNEDIENWDGKIVMRGAESNGESNENIEAFGEIENMLLRGCYLRNAKYCIGIAVYLGKQSKIMMNAKKPPRKVSKLMKMMNYMLYTIFGFQFIIIFTFACASAIWNNAQGKDYTYLDMSGDNFTFYDWFIQLLTYWVAYSHMIPISLYVMIEVLKLTQATLIKWDKDIGADPNVDEMNAE
jgi:magnesium-transporting ATPase (P-type)